MLMTVVVQSLSCVTLFATPWTTACQFPLFFTISLNLLTHIHRVGEAIQSSQPLLSPSPPASNLPQHQSLYQRISSSHHGASASESVLPMNIQGWTPLGLTGLVSLLSKGLLKSLLQHHSLKASVLWCSAFLVQSHICTWLLEKP